MDTVSFSRHRMRAVPDSVEAVVRACIPSQICEMIVGRIAVAVTPNSSVGTRSNERTQN